MTNNSVISWFEKLIRPLALGMSKYAHFLHRSVSNSSTQTLFSLSRALWTESVRDDDFKWAPHGAPGRIPLSIRRLSHARANPGQDRPRLSLSTHSQPSSSPRRTNLWGMSTIILLHYPNIFMKSWHPIFNLDFRHRSRLLRQLYQGFLSRPFGSHHASSSHIWPAQCHLLLHIAPRLAILRYDWMILIDFMRFYPHPMPDSIHPWMTGWDIHS